MTDKELRTLDEMLTNLEIWSTWNKTFANEMIGICSKMRNLLADRKDEPQTDNGIGCSRCEGRFDCYDRDMPYAVRCNNYGKITDEPQTEPLQTCSVNGRPYTDCCNCEYFKCTADEPQTERSE